MLLQDGTAKLTVSPTGFIASEGEEGEDSSRLDDQPPISGPKVYRPDIPPDYKQDKSSLPFTSFNYINAIVGSGVIGKILYNKQFFMKFIIFF